MQAYSDFADVRSGKKSMMEVLWNQMLRANPVTMPLQSNIDFGTGMTGEANILNPFSVYNRIKGRGNNPLSRLKNTGSDDSGFFDNMLASSGGNGKSEMIITIKGDFTGLEENNQKAVTNALVDGFKNNRELMKFLQTSFVRALR